MTPGTSRTLMGCELQAPTTTERPWPWLARSTPQPAATVLCDLPAAFPRWRWQDAPRLRPRAHHIAQAHAALRALATALQHGNAAVLADLLALRHRELAMAYPGHPPLLPPIDGLKWQWPGLDDFRLLPQAGGRLHEAVDRQGRPALAAFDRQGQRQRDWPLRLAYLDRRWTVVR
ncbi:hypothetical protein [Roseateles sp. YR242]|uniref:hypothetical protein n=1 Tax=Roseateles sp. YR242 TaxID=1855305 RepID=UPI001160A58E|nr:hypothetical protein [Roseateles sp. YR242]